MENDVRLRPRSATFTLRIPSWLIIVFCAAVVIVFLILAFAKLSNTETVLLGVVQTIFSLISGWAITHTYASSEQERAIREVEDIYQRNIRTYALKAAEKVENLSRELGRLSTYLQEELIEDDYSSVGEELLAKEERLQSAIHLLNTLKSVNDTSLSDWRGVIGDELEEIRQRNEQREETLQKLTEKLDRLNPIAIEQIAGTGVAVNSLVREVEKIKRDLKFVASDVTSGIWTTRKIPSEKTLYKFSCPSCSATLSARIRSRQGSVKAVTCDRCSERLVATVVSMGEVSIHRRETIFEIGDCPACGYQNRCGLDELVGASIEFECKECGTPLRGLRSSNGFELVISNRVQAVKRRAPLTLELLNAIKEALPPQPWPRGTREKVAVALNLDDKVVQKGIAQLIMRGDFQDQYKGLLCTPEEKLLLINSLGKDL